MKSQRSLLCSLGRLTLYAGVLTGLLAFLGCEKPEPTMTVQLDFGPMEQSCLDAEITVVDYTLFGAEGVVRTEQGVPMQLETEEGVDCAELLFSFIEEDTYGIEVHGFSSDGIERFVGTCTELPFERDDVVHRCNVEVTVAPLEVQVLWDLVQSELFMPGTCWMAGVRRYEFVLRDVDGEVVSAEPQIACDGPDSVLLDFGSLPTGTYNLRVTGYSDDDVANWEGDCTYNLVAGTSGSVTCDARDD